MCLCADFKRLENSHFMNGRLRGIIDSIKELGERDNISAVLVKVMNTID